MVALAMKEYTANSRRCQFLLLSRLGPCLSQRHVKLLIPAALQGRSGRGGGSGGNVTETRYSALPFPLHLGGMLLSLPPSLLQLFFVDKSL